MSCLSAHMWLVLSIDGPRDMEPITVQYFIPDNSNKLSRRIQNHTLSTHLGH